MTEVEVIRIGTQDRFLGTHRSTKALACPVVADDNPDAPIIDESEWVEQDPPEQFIPPLADQNGVGACNAFAATNLLTTQRLVSGFEWYELFPGDLYGRINGGRDQGSTLEDALDALLREGVADRDPSLALYEWRRRTANTASRANNKILEYNLCPGYRAIMSQTQRGFAVAFGCGVGGNFEADSRGYVPPARGRTGGHAMILLPFAMKVINGRKCPAVFNSWQGWGIDGRGWAWLDPSYLSDGGWNSYSARVVTLPDSLKVRA